MIYHSQSYNPSSDLRRTGYKITFEIDGTCVAVTEEDIVSLKIEEEIDIHCERFPKRKLNAEIINKDGFLRMLSYIGTKISTHACINGEYIHTGDFYIDRLTYKNGGSTVILSASDMVTTMERTLTGIAVSTPRPLTYIIVMESGAAAGLSFCTDSENSDILVCPDMYSDIDTQSNCLLYLAQAAAMSSIWIDRSGIINIRRITSPILPVREIDINEIIDVNGVSEDRIVDFVRLTGSNPSGETNSTAGRYYRGCYMQQIKNDFLVPSYADLAASNYLESKGFRFRVLLKTRCDPSIEVGDWVSIHLERYSASGNFIVAKQTICFDCKGLSSQLELVSNALFTSQS